MIRWPPIAEGFIEAFIVLTVWYILALVVIGTRNRRRRVGEPLLSKRKIRQFILIIFTGIAIFRVSWEIALYSGGGYKFWWFLDGRVDAVFNPTWSPDGEKIAFECMYLTYGVSDLISNYYPASHPRDICVIDVDGEKLERINLDNEFGYFPAWSPEGDKLAWGTMRPNDALFYIRDVSFKELEIIDNAPRTGRVPHSKWFDNGRKIHLAGGITYDLEEKKFNELKESSILFYDQVLVSPTGHYFALVELANAGTKDQQYSLVVWEDGEEIYRYPLASRQHFTLLIWLQDDDTILYLENSTDLCLFHLPTLRDHCFITGIGWQANIELSPLENRLAYPSKSGGNLDVYTFNPKLSINNTLYTKQTYQIPYFNRQGRFSFSPDGNAITFGIVNGINILDLENESIRTLIEVIH